MTRFVDIDVRAEIEAYEWGDNAKWSQDKLIAASPFRYDKTPSFFVRLEDGGIDEDGRPYRAGTWSDSGAYDDEWRSGNIVKLLSFLRSETYEETEAYLREKYTFEEGEKREIKPPAIGSRRGMRVLSDSLIEPAVSPYLTQRRGIAPDVILAAGVGRPRNGTKGFVALPWRLTDGRLVNIKYRATRGKMFFYEEGGEPIRNIVWGMDSVKPADVCVVCEAEIDALSWRTAGIEAVALGGINVSQRKADLLRSIPAGRLIVAGDNDKAGAAFNRVVVKALHGKANLALLRWPDDMKEKDANDVLRVHGAGRLVELSQENTILLPNLKKITI